jgi:hypothetical protein
MNAIDASRAYLVGEVERLESLGFIALVPAGQPLSSVQVGRDEDGGFVVAVPARPKIAPELPVEARKVLLDRGLHSEDPADRTHAWMIVLPDAATGIDLARSLLGEAFAMKPDVPLDILHGSRRGEFETRRKLDFIRERVERLLTRMLDVTPERDDDGDFQLPLNDVRVTVAPRALPNGPIIVRVFAVTNVSVSVTPDLGLFLARLNFSLMFGRFALDAENSAIWFDETLLGEHFSDEEFRFAVHIVSTTADQWDDKLKQMFGGATFQESLKQSSGTRPPVKPGEGPGLYL